MICKKKGKAMNFIELTYRNGIKFFCNLDKVTTIEPSSEEGACITFNENNDIFVRESPEQIDLIIQELKKQRKFLNS